MLDANASLSSPNFIIFPETSMRIREVKSPHMHTCFKPAIQKQKKSDHITIRQLAFSESHPPHVSLTAGFLTSSRWTYAYSSLSVSGPQHQ